MPAANVDVDGDHDSDEVSSFNCMVTIVKYSLIGCGRTSHDDMDVDSHSHANVFLLLSFHLKHVIDDNQDVLNKDHGGEDVDASHNLGVSSHLTTCFNYLILSPQCPDLCSVLDGSLFLMITIYNMTLDLWTLCVLSVGLITGYKNMSPQPVFETLNLKCAVNMEKSRSLCCPSLHNHYTTSFVDQSAEALDFCQNIVQYNTSLTFTSMGVDIDHSVSG